MHNLKDFSDSAKQAATLAGEYIRSASGNSHQIEHKAKFDLVTEVDRNSEALIRGYLSKKYPDHLFFGEEEISSAEEDEDTIISKLPQDRYIWVIDPVDGTTNFVRGIPSYAVSIGLMYNSEILVSAVYDVHENDLYWAMLGGGAYCNERRLSVSEVDDTERAIVSTSFPAADLELRRMVTEKISRERNKVFSLRIWNCAALAICSVAAGRTDAHIELGIHLWDFAAGKLLVEEAGGSFTDVDGRPFHRYEKHLCTSNGKLQKRILEIIK